MNNCVDNIFGEMTFRHSWFKKEVLELWNDNPLEIKIVAQAHTGESITDTQRENYQLFKKNKPAFFAKAKEVALAYCKQNFEKDLTIDRLLSAIRPTSILFARTGEWGILFSCIWDEEAGLAVKFSDGNAEAGSQDILL